MVPIRQPTGISVTRGRAKVVVTSSRDWTICGFNAPSKTRWKVPPIALRVAGWFSIAQGECPNLPIYIFLPLRRRRLRRSVIFGVPFVQLHNEWAAPREGYVLQRGQNPPHLAGMSLSRRLPTLLSTWPFRCVGSLAVAAGRSSKGGRRAAF